MERPRFIAYGCILILLWATAAVLRFAGEPPAGPEINMRLPDRLLGYDGATVLFCQSAQCGHSFTGLSPSLPCPDCGAKLSDTAAAEKALLPPNTRILRRRYVRSGSQTVLVTVVFSQGERRSIHRPQICLTGQGFAITDERPMQVAVAGRAPLQVMLLDVTRGGRSDYQAYWFVNAEGRETARHLVRLLWSAWDGVVRNRRPAWAYVTVTSTHRDERRKDEERLRAFIGELYPFLRASPCE